MSARKERERRRESRIQEEARAQEGARRNRLLRLGGATAAAVLAAVIILIVVAAQQHGSGGDTQLEDVEVVEQQLEGIPQHGMTLGKPEAGVTLVEFGDLQCPICRAYAEEVLPRVINGSVRRGEAKLEFRNYTIIGEQSVPAGAAALAAGEQGRGWSFVELFYRNQGEERSGYVTPAFLTAIAKGAGVPDIARWNRERKSKRLLSEVSKTKGEAEGLEFTGTPSFATEGSAGLEPIGTPESTEAIEAAIHDAE